MTTHEPADGIDIATIGDKVDFHRENAMFHADLAVHALNRMTRPATPGESRPAVLHQQIGVNLKLADVHARLALAAAQSGGHA